MLSRQNMNKLLFWVVCVHPEFPFQRNLSETTKGMGCFRMVSLSDPRIQHLSHGKRKAQLKDFVELLESPARNFRGGLETEFDKKKVMRIASYHVNKCFRKMNLRLYSSDRPVRVFWPQNEGVSNSQRLNVVKLMCIPLTLLGFFGYMAST